MKIYRSWRGLVIGVVLCAVSAAPARAGSFFRDIAYGLSFLAAPANPSPTRFGQFSATYEPIPRGWRVDFIRVFGPDALGRPNSIDLGFADLTLNSGRVELRAQQSTRVMDTYMLSLNTPVPINYTFTLNTGVQDVNINGVFAMAENGMINQYGFYDLQLNVSNRGEATSDGFALVDQQTLDYDIGPINVSGNIFTDILASVTEPIFAGAGVQNPFAKFSGRATKEAELSAPIEALRAKVERGETVTQDDLDTIAEAEFLASLLNVTLPDLDFLSQVDVEAILQETATQQPAADSGDVADPSDFTMTPEPATLTFLIVPTAMVVLSRRRRRI